MLPEEYISILTKLNEHIQCLKACVKILEARNLELELENKRLKELLHEKGAAKGTKEPVFKKNYSVEKQKEQTEMRCKWASSPRG
jgi:regulator of replication initiation timing